MDRRAFLGRMLLMPFGVLAKAQAKTDRKRRVHLKDVYIAGTQYHDLSQNEDLARLAAEDPLLLRREPENKHDEYTIQVLMTSGAMIGYIPRHQNRTIARIMDPGVEVVAFVDRVAPDSSPWRRIWIRAEEKV